MSPSLSSSGSSSALAHHSNAHAAATALLSRSNSNAPGSSGGYAQHGAPSTRITADLDTLATTRGGDWAPLRANALTLARHGLPPALPPPSWTPTASAGPQKPLSTALIIPLPKQPQTKPVSLKLSRPYSNVSRRSFPKWPRKDTREVCKGVAVDDKGLRGQIE